ncbi:MAG TPA: hypothetical protein VF747_16590 [Blastocatellia bacterium]|jgi:hypothetical protein
MGLDIRLPIGLLFSFLGALLILSGLITNREAYQRSLGININLWWGFAMLAFGVVMLLLGRRGTSAMRQTSHSPEGEMIEEREVRAGLETKPTHHS